MRLIFLGPPGAGKGTQAEILSKQFAIPTISTGTILREAVKNNTSIGQKAKAYMDAGELVPDEVIIGIVEERLAQPDCQNGYILDGVPRTIPQAEALEAAGIVFDYVVAIIIADEEILSRMDGRRVCTVCGTPFHLANHPPKQSNVCDVCGGVLIQRDDDKPEVVRARLKVYHAQTTPLVDFYEKRGVLKRVDNRPTPKATTEAILEVMELPCR